MRARFSYPPLDYVPTVPAMWRAVVEAHGERELVVATRGDGATDRITYGDADERSADLARRLLAIGVGKGTRVGLLAPNGPDFAVAAIAVGRIGAVLVPINTLFQPAELGWVLRHGDVHTLLTVPSILGKSCVERVETAVPALARASAIGDAPLHIPAFPFLRHVAVLGDDARAWTSPLEGAVDDELLKAAESTVTASDDFAVIYSSGSSAEPKGVIHTQGALIRHAQFLATEHGWTCADRVYVPMAFFWIGGLVFGFYGPLQLGVTILTEHRFEAGDVLAFLSRERVTYATGWAHVGPALANHPDFPTTDLSTLRDGYQQILLPPERRTADPTLRVAQLGMTETCSSHTWWPPSEELPEEKRGSVGLTGPGFEHKIVDEEGTPVPNGTVGEICVRGAALMRGMVGRSRVEIFDEDGWYHTRDAGSFDDDGFLYFTGRTDDMIKTSGANVSPVEVESVLVAMDEVREAYVVGVPDPARGAIVTGVIVTARGMTVTAPELVARCREQLAAYKVPKRWEIVPNTESLPYTTTNKIDRRALVEQLANGSANERSIVNECVYLHQRTGILMGQRGAMVEMIRNRWAPHLERKYGVRLFGVWATVGSTGEWPEVRVQWEFDDWDHFARASDGQHPMEERDTYLTELWNQALDFRRGGHSLLLQPTAFAPNLASIRSDAIVADVVLCENVRSKPGRMAAYHDALATTFAPLAESQGLRLLGAYEHAVVPNMGLNLWGIANWDEWKTFMQRTAGAGELREWNRGLGQWLSDLDGFLVVTPPTEALRT